MRLTPIALLLLFAPSPSLAQRGIAAAIPVVVRDTGGQTHALGSYLQGRTLLHIWGTWCSECLEVAPRYNALADTLRADSMNVVNVAIEVNGLAHWQSVAGRVGRGLQLFYDSEATSDSNGYLGLSWVKSIPAYLAIDPSGNVVGEWYEVPTAREVEKNQGSWR